jgi:hypothetical protein
MIVHATVQTGERCIVAYGCFFLNDQTVEIGGGCGINEGSSLTGCFAVSTGDWLPTYRSSFMTPYSGSGGSISLFE